MTKILVAEDDAEINRLICEYLTSEGYEVITAANGIQALSILQSQNDISLLVLDIMMPYQSGDVVLKKLREFSDLPVIILSAKDMVQTKIDVMRMGADDYITKPFDLDEVLVRIEAVLRRTGKTADKDVNKLLQFKKLCLDTNSKTVTVDGSMIDITSKEYGILMLLLENPTKLFSKANLYESIWEEAYFSEDNTLKVHMSNLRNKIKKYDAEEYIETVWGMGYRLKN